MKAEELLLGSDLLLLRCATIGPDALLRLSSACLCWETYSVCRGTRFRLKSCRELVHQTATRSNSLSFLTWAAAACTTGLRSRRRFGCRNRRWR